MLPKLAPLPYHITSFPYIYVLIIYYLSLFKIKLFKIMLYRDVFTCWFYVTLDLIICFPCIIQSSAKNKPTDLVCALCICISEREKEKKGRKGGRMRGEGKGRKKGRKEFKELAYVIVVTQTQNLEGRLVGGITRNL